MDHWDNDIIMAVLILETLSSYVIQLVLVAVDPLYMFASYTLLPSASSREPLLFAKPVAKYDGAVKLA